MLGATDTAKRPEVAPVGIVAIIAVGLQELIVSGDPFSNTWLVDSEVPKPEPDTTTWLPTAPVVAESPVIAGAGEVVELIDTLSNVAVARVEPVSLLTARPTYTFVAIVIV
jgi:hypothetical protein